MSMRALIRNEFHHLFLDDEVQRRVYTITDILQRIMDSSIPINMLVRPVGEEFPQEIILQPPEVVPHQVAAYNIIPLDDVPDVNNAITSFPEVRAAKSSLKYNELKILEHLPNLPGDFSIPATRSADVLDVLHCIFGFQKGNVSNQRENIVNLLSNEQSQLHIPDDENDPKLDSVAVESVFCMCLDNYIQWCEYLDTPPMWSKCKCCEYEIKGSDVCKNRRTLYLSLYFLIWGEAANVRFLPECLCYIFHRMGEELNCMLEQDNENLTLVDEDGDKSFLKKVIFPIYNVIAEESRKIKKDKVPHSSWGNYDDFNEYFWSSSCLKLDRPCPLNKTSPLPFETSQWSTLHNMLNIGPRKNSFVERRTFLHLYHSFHRLWIFLSMTFQGLAIIAFNDGKLNSKTLFHIFSLGPTYFAMKIIQSVLDIFMSATFSTSNLLDIKRNFICFIWFSFATICIWCLYVIGLPVTIISIIVLGIFAYIQFDRSAMEWFQSFQNLVKWIHQDLYVGRDMKETRPDKLMYTSFWLVVLALKFSFAYFFQIMPLVEPTWKITANKGFIPTIKDTHNVLVLASLWVPVFIMYLLDIYIFYTIISAVVGFFRGKKDRLGEIKSLDDFRKRFHEFPGKFMDKLLVSGGSSVGASDLDNAIRFSPFWNEIVNKLLEEDYISILEFGWLRMPIRNENVRVVQWPLFLLGNKIFPAKDIAGEGVSQEKVWARISEDRYMKCAVEECFCILELILTSFWNDDGKLWVKELYEEIRRSIKSQNIYSVFEMENLKVVIERVTALVREILNEDVTQYQLKTAAALDLYDYIHCNFFKNPFRWNQFEKARNYNRLFSIICTINPQLRSQVLRLLWLLTPEHSTVNVPKNPEARRRLEFFTNSLFMEMPKTKLVREMLPFSVFTPYYEETVIYSQKELFEYNEDGISLLYNLQTIYPDDWEHFLARISRGANRDQSDLINNEAEMLELRLWASYRGQTLARTVRSMMYYQKALMLQSYLDRIPSGDMDAAASDNEAKAIADLKFTYVVSCQKYGQQRKKGASQAADIALLLQRNDALRVAFIDERETDNGEKEYFSKLVKGDGLNGIEKEVYSIKLPGNPILGEGKPENQNHAIIFTRGNAIQTVDMNQDNYFEETLKMRNLLEEFHANKKIPPTIPGVTDHPSSRSVISSSASFTSKMKNLLKRFLVDQKIRPTILGVREHVFTGSVSSLASFMSNQETSFVTLGQRVLASPLKVRMHYGHPDVFDRVFHITRGGISKASPVINISEDIYAGFNSTLRNGNITHHEYIQVGKGRDVGLNQIALFEGKVAAGNGEQVLSRDVYRLGQLFNFFRMLSFYFTTVGYYFCSMLTVVTVYLLLYRKLYLALFESRPDVLNNSALNTPFSLLFVIQIVFLTALPMFFGDCLEKGFKKAIKSFMKMQGKLCTLFFTFSLGTRAHYFGRTILHGGAKYHATGRGFAVQHIRISENYRLYSRSHFVKGFEVVLLLSVYRLDGLVIKETGELGNILTYGSWFMAISWIIAPLLFNPSSFEWGEIKNNLKDWKDWTFTSGRTRSDGTPVTRKESWEPWWNEEVSHIRTLEGRVMETILSLRFFIFQYGVVKNKWDIQGSNTLLLIYVYSWPMLLSLLFALELTDRCDLFISNNSFSSLSRHEIRVQFNRYFLVVSFGITTVALVILPVIDKKAFILAFISTGWGILSICVAWKPMLEKMGLSKSVTSLAWLYDLGMGGLILLVQICCKLIHMDTIQHLISTNPEFSQGLQMRRSVLSR